MPPVAFAPAARRRLEVVLVLEVAEGGLTGIDRQVDGAPAPAVAAVRPAARHVGFAPERRGAVTTRARAHEDLDPIEEHRGHCPTPSGTVRPPHGPAG